jgi:hypothetical protein
MRNTELQEAPFCEACKCLYVQVHDPESQGAHAERSTGAGPLQRLLNALLEPFATALTIACFLLILLSLAADPRWRWLAIALFGPFLLAPIAMGGIVFGSFLAGLKELRALVRDHRIRTIHGLEHATAHILEQRGVTVFGGYTGPTFFRLWIAYGDISCDTMRAAFEEAVKRVHDGERRLAYHRRCGTSYLVVALVASVLGLLAGAIGLFARIDFVTLMVASAVYVLLLGLAGGRLGLVAQKTLTVSTGFEHAHAVRVLCRADEDRGAWYDVHVEVDLPVKDASPSST